LGLTTLRTVLPLLAWVLPLLALVLPLLAWVLPLLALVLPLLALVLPLLAWVLDMRAGISTRTVRLISLVSSSREAIRRGSLLMSLPERAVAGSRSIVEGILLSVDEVARLTITHRRSGVTGSLEAVMDLRVRPGHGWTFASVARSAMFHRALVVVVARLLFLFLWLVLSLLPLVSGSIATFPGPGTILMLPAHARVLAAHAAGLALVSQADVGVLGLPPCEGFLGLSGDLRLRW